jgi:uncharacterized membrane protein
MTTIANAKATSTAPVEHFFALWGDMATWPEWNTDTEWVRLDGPFQTGSTGVLKPKGGPKVRFVLDSVVPEREFVDVSLLLGARLTFRHDVSVSESGGTQVDVTISISGPLAAAWKLVLGKGLRGTAQPDLDRLAAVCEGR